MDSNRSSFTASPSASISLKPRLCQERSLSSTRSASEFQTNGYVKQHGAYDGSSPSSEVGKASMVTSLGPHADFVLKPGNTDDPRTISSILLTTWVILSFRSEIIQPHREADDCKISLRIQHPQTTEDILSLQVHVPHDCRVPDLLSSVQQQWLGLVSSIDDDSEAARLVRGSQSKGGAFMIVISGSRDRSFLVRGSPKAQFSIRVMTSWQENGHCKLMAASEDEVWNGEAQLLLSRFEHVVRQVSESTALLINQVDLFSPADMSMIRSWNGYCAEKQDECVHVKFEQHAAKSPQDVAVNAWDGTFTYVELNHLSTRLALALERLSVGPGTLVPLCFEKSKWTVVAILGILKSGAGYVPLDPRYPSQRVQEICVQVKAHIVVASEMYRGLFDSLNFLKVIAVHAKLFSQKPVTLSRDFVPVTVSSDDIFCVIFTSGSTGTPKGVILHHTAILSSAMAHGRALRFSPKTRALQFAAHTFDVSVMEIFTTLIFGGCVCIPSDAERMNNLPDAINRMDVNWSFLTPSVASLLQPELVLGLERLTLGGEPVSLENINTWSNRDLSMVYAPSECTVLCHLHRRVEDQTNPSSLGRPCGGQTYIVDPEDYQKLMPIGETGELLITGPIVGRGYLQDEAKTAAAFKPLPYWCTADNESGGLAYKSGDLVRYAHDGSVLYVARKDTQVKLHGQRLELREIEFRLASHPSITYCAAILPTEGLYSGRLVAVFRPRAEHYSQPAHNDGPFAIIPSSSLLTPPDDLRIFLATFIPANLLPTVWIALQELPLTSSGKIDRVSVKAWLHNGDSLIPGDDAGDAKEPEFTATRNSTELIVQRVCAEILNVPLDRLALDVSFMRLGGDSITAMQMVSKLRREGILLTVQQILQSTTFQSLATVARKNEHLSSLLVDSERVDAPFDLAPIQSLHFQIRPDGANHHNQGFLINLKQRIGQELLERSVKSLTSHHSMLRAKFQKVNGSWTQMITSKPKTSFRIMVHDIENEDARLPVIRESNRKFNISEGPIFAADLFNIRCMEHQQLFVNAHHLIMDLVSWRVVLADLEDLFKGKILSPIKPMSFQTWTELQIEHSRETEMAKGLTYPSVPDFDMNRYWGVEEKNVMGDVEELRFELDQHTTSRLRGSANQCFSTEPIDIQLATMAHSFTQTFSDRNSITVFNEGHGREPWAGSDIDLSRTVGWFTTMYPFEFTRSKDVLEKVRESKLTRLTAVDKGRSYFAARFYHEQSKDKHWHHKQMEVVFNYQGSYQQLEREDSIIQRMPWGDLESTMHAPDLQRYALIEIESAIDAGQLKVVCTFNRAMKQQDKIKKWLQSWKQMLQDTCERLTYAKPQYVLADFPLLRLEDRQFLGLMNSLNADYHINTEPGAQIVGMTSCTGMQEGILLSQERDAKVYHISISWRTSSNEAVAPDKLATAWRQVVERHNILRAITVPTASDGEGLYALVFLKVVDPDIVILECGKDENMIASTPTAAFTHGAPRHRLTMVNALDSGITDCQLEICHSIVDGVSLDLLFKDFARAYQETSCRQCSTSFIAYAEFLQEHLYEDHGREYWTEKLGMCEPTIFPQLIEPQEATRIQTRQLVRSEKIDCRPRSDLETFCSKNGVTLATLVRTVWSLMLRWYTGVRTPVFGYLLDGRDINVEGIEGAIGPIIHMAISCSSFSTEVSVAEALRQVQMDHLSSLPFQNVPLSRINRWLKRSGAALFNTVVSMEYHPQPEENDSIHFRRRSTNDPTEVLPPIIDIYDNTNMISTISLFKSMWAP